MKRHQKREAKPDNKKAQILETALEVFSRYGYEGTTIRDICKAAGLSGSVIHYHWDSKEHLWRDVIELCSGRLLEILERHADFSLPPQQVFPMLLEKAFDELIKPDLVRITLWHTLEADASDYETTDLFFKRLNEFGMEYMKGIQEAGEAEPVDLELTLQSIRDLFVLMAADQRGHRLYYGKDLSDPEHRARVKAHFLRAALALLGLKSEVGK